MIKYFSYLVSGLLFLGLSSEAHAQQDPFAGEWTFNKFQHTDSAVIFNLKIAEPEKNLLYPAEAILQSGNKSYTFTLLFAKRNIRKIAIGRPILTENEDANPRLLENFSGYLDLHRTLNGNFEATMQRLLPPAFSKAQNTIFTPEEKRIFHVLQDETFSFQKTSDQKWVSPKTFDILNANPDSPYYGIHDSIFVNNRDVLANFNFRKKTGNGTLSLTCNGIPVIDQVNLTVNRPEEDIRLDTGMNILILFTDQFGRKPSTTGKLELKTEKGIAELDHREEKDEKASFIAIRIFYEAKDPTPEESIILREYYERLNSPDNISTHPELLSRDSLGNFIPPRSRKQSDAELLKRSTQPVGNIAVRAKEITLAIWDDAVEDGDTISLRINDKWVVQDMAVKKKPQFLTVQVNPGPNKITFIAENLGAIIPNTSVLEINDGRQRKAFFIDTDLSTNNLVNIIYDPGG